MLLLALLLAAQSPGPTDLKLGPGIYTLAEICREAGLPESRVKIERNIARKRFAVYLPHTSLPDLEAKLDAAFGIKTESAENSLIHIYEDPSRLKKEQQVRKRILDAVAGAFERQGQDLAQNRPATWSEVSEETQALAEEILNPARFKRVTEAQIMNQSSDPKWNRWVALNRLRGIGDWLGSFSQAGDYDRVFREKQAVFNPFSADSAMKQFGLTIPDLIPQSHLFRDEPIASLSIGVAYGFDWRNLKFVCQPAVFGAKDWFEFGETETTLVPPLASRLDTDLRFLFHQGQTLNSELLDRRAPVPLGPGWFGQSEALLKWAEAFGQPLLADFSLTSDREGSVDFADGERFLTLRRILTVPEPAPLPPQGARAQSQRLMELTIRPESAALNRSISNRIFRQTEANLAGDCLVVKHTGMPLVEWLDPDPSPLFIANGSATKPIKSPWLRGLGEVRAFARSLPSNRLDSWSPMYARVEFDDKDALRPLLPALSWLRLIEDRGPSEADQIWAEAVKTDQVTVALSKLASQDRLIETLNEQSALSITGTFGCSRAWQTGIADADLVLNISKSSDGSPKELQIFIRNRNIPWQAVRFNVDLG